MEEDKYMIFWGYENYVGVTIKKPPHPGMAFLKSFNECKKEIIKAIDKEIDILRWQKKRIMKLKKEDIE